MKTLLMASLSVYAISNAFAAGLPQPPVIAYDCDSCEKLSRVPLSYSWAADTQSLALKKALKPRPSKSLQRVMTLAELRRGINVHTHADGAIVRVSVQKSRGNAALASLRILTPDGVEHAPSEVAEVHTPGAGLAGADEHALPTVMVLNKNAGHGKFVLKSTDTAIDETTPVFVHVYDRYSDISLEVSTEKEHYYFGEELVVKVRMDEEDDALPIDYMTLTLRSPEGETWPLSFYEVDEGLYEARMPLPEARNSHGENWYVEVFAESWLEEDTISLSTHIAFSCSIQSGAVRSIRQTGSTPEFLESEVEVATASRYGLQAVLYGTGADGRKLPVSIHQTAQWLEPGKHTLKLQMNIPADSNAGAPWSVGYLQLTDYGQYKPVYRFDELLPLTEEHA
ncbi:hypothetical protein Lgee_0053 [Legionella geestiana]|uniref:Uncharacterized protein n=1 Tax=Legionella geestiana TaxID=45065 RepID=A0A0W0UAL4_9GAMM|nr:DUF4785 domain-containing protein [Legionella geestiana]KTD04869.1 hypothetical protein Lgee_0053 [Legionella geestiana]QBS11305.1 DUF4785 family protein [Legionella geestiana]STX54057.1 Uncharacterised protein [Legionella geestiana]